MRSTAARSRVRRCGWIRSGDKETWRQGDKERATLARLYLPFSLSPCLARRGAADELDLVAVGVIHIHRAAGEHRVLSAARRVARRYQRVVLLVEFGVG